MGPMSYPANTATPDQALGQTLDQTGDWAADAEARVLAQALQLAPAQGWT